MGGNKFDKQTLNSGYLYSGQDFLTFYVPGVARGYLPTPSMKNYIEESNSNWAQGI